MNQELRDDLLRYACALLGGDRDAAEDVVQEALIALTRAPEAVRDPRRYARRAVHNLCAHCYRDRRELAQGERVPPASPLDRVSTGELLQRLAALVHLAVCGNDRNDGSTSVALPSQTRVDREQLQQLLMFHAAVAAALPLRNASRLRADLGRRLAALDERAFSCLLPTPAEGERPSPRPTVHDPETLVRHGALLALRLCRDLSEREAERLARRVVEERRLDLSGLALVYVHQPDSELEDASVDAMRGVLEELEELAAAGEETDLWLLVEGGTERQVVVYQDDDGALHAAVPGNGFLRGRDRLRLDEQERLRLIGWSSAGEPQSDLTRCWAPDTDLSWVAADLLDTFWVLHDEAEPDLQLELAA